MKKNKFIKSTIILIIGGLITKMLGFIIRIIYTRIIGEQGISLYMLVIPSYSLFVTIAQLGLPIAISKLVAEANKRGKKIVLSALPIMIIINILLIAVIFVTAPFIATKLLHEPNTKYLLMAMSLVLPFISLSSLLRGYFFGKQKMLPHTISNIVEDIAKIGLIILIIPKLMQININVAVIGLILLSIVTETISIIVFLIFLPRKIKINIEDIKPDINTMKDIFKISIPSVSSRFIGNIGYFFEPIILTSILLLIGYSKDFVILEYGIYNAYVIPTLLIPAFFINAISQALIPEVSKYNSVDNHLMVQRRFKQAIIISLLLGISINILMFIFGPLILNIIYHTTSGINYLRILLPFFIFFYLEGPIVSMLHALGETKKSMQITLLGVIVKLLIITISSLFHIGIYSLVIAEIINIFLVVTLNYLVVRKTIY